MAKTRSVFFCKECGYESAKWMGNCPSCNTWNSFTEEIISKSNKETPAVNWRENRDNSPKTLNEIAEIKETRLPLPDKELNRVIGEGLVPGSVILVGGEPGIGKSTLMLQLALDYHHGDVLYVSGEESATQIKMRAERLNKNAENCYFLTENSLETIFKDIKQLRPSLLIVDSIQTVQSMHADSPPGSLSQIKQSAHEIIQFAKETDTPVFLIGHINKEGAIAGPKVLEHMVDTVIQFEGDKNFAYRILRTIKNRFGSTSEIGIYSMDGEGLKEVSNPSEILINSHGESFNGTTVTATLEGNRPLLIETQSLVSPATYGTPQRSCTGFDSRRLNMLLAVIERRCGFRLGAQDVFLNMAGGIRVSDPAVDLGICCSIISSMEEIPVSGKVCFAAEIGLGGELRPVSKIENRIAEAEKLGYESIYVSKFAKINGKHNIDIVKYGELKDTFQKLF